MAHFLKYTNAVFANIEKMSEFGGEAIFDVFKKPSVETKKRKAVSIQRGDGLGWEKRAHRRAPLYAVRRVAL